MRASFAIISVLLAANGMANAVPADSADTVRVIANVPYDSVELFGEKVWSHSTTEEDETSVGIPLDNDDDSIDVSTLPNIVDRAEYMKWHNAVRARHNAVPLIWSNVATEAAQTWANRCVFQHGGGKAGGFGENIGAGTGNYNLSVVITAWENQGEQYDPRKPKATDYTQLVWKSTRQFGCAYATCTGMFPGEKPATFHVCEYLPAGNIPGQFGQNVQ